MDDLQQELEIGKQAEDFLRYTSEHPYFNGLLERIKLEMARVILDLNFSAKDEFSDMKSQMVGVDQIMNAIQGDIYIAREALKRLNGETEEPKGLL
jgi:phosphoenolpyruvate carboxylase